MGDYGVSKDLLRSGQMNGTQVEENGTEARRRNLIRLERIKIAHAADRSIGMFTKDPWGPPVNRPQHALAVSLIFTKATNQTIMLGTPPKHVLSTSILWRSLSHDKRFEQVPVSEVEPGDIVIESHPSQADGYTGIVVDHGRVVSHSNKGVRDDTSLAKIQRHRPEMAAFRYLGFRNFYLNPSLANEGYDATQPRRPSGQSGGGRWTKDMVAPSTVALSGKDSRISSETATISGEPDRSHDNSAGNPGVIIYTNNKYTYNRYTTMP